MTEELEENVSKPFLLSSNTHRVPSEQWPERSHTRRDKRIGDSVERCSIDPEETRSSEDHDDTDDDTTSVIHKMSKLIRDSYKDDRR